MHESCSVLNSLWLLGSPLQWDPEMGTRTGAEEDEQDSYPAIFLGCHTNTEILMYILDKRQLFKKKPKQIKPNQEKNPKQTPKLPNPQTVKSECSVASYLAGRLLLVFLPNTRISQWWISALVKSWLCWGVWKCLGRVTVFLRAPQSLCWGLENMVDSTLTMFAWNVHILTLLCITPS